MPSACDGKPSRCESFAQIDNQREQSRGSVSATGPQQVLVRPAAKLIDTQFKWLELKAGSDVAQFRQSCHGNIAEESQCQVNRFQPGRFAAKPQRCFVAYVGQ